MSYHNPVLLHESVDALDIKEGGVYVDVTFGGGGHSREILSRLGENGRLFAFDQDPDALENKIDDKRFVLIAENFRYISRFLRFYGISKVDGILADLGVSSHQFDVAERGFSTRFDADLDMRMDQNSKKSAKFIINKYSEERLADILFLYGELRNGRALSKKIVAARKEEEIRTSFQLKEVLQEFLPKAKEHKILAQIFQAVRIEVNQELEVLKEFLEQIPTLLNSTGRLSVISYHSLEDRLVKRFIQMGKFSGEPEKDFFGNTSEPLKKVGKLIIPTPKEIKLNNRARSAKLRIATLKK
ncbi:16S rRNA (cytosine(1402)-N(4))-methyltransferase [Tenacibaculum todarodis]|uniref:Ribosomal RNA small subunit methyltransferase H n=1 Tax=Tenacibaculum todarodis TaxID=1850252 RepID=A0A1L3JJD2_9FLAO|nr:16S rRNA (cytosine(1402)-N(4))-methyltransferase RsmH [Tenacibaculum todarodis]APG65251.1 16S rRNA (cytosine(1402)-N(4))-methyltransferase [Tenacibaculum todarodis]